MVSNFPLFALLIGAMTVVNVLFALSPQRWKEGHRNQYQVVLLVLMAGITAVLFATGGPMFLSIAFAVITLFFCAVFVVSGWVKRSRVSGRAS